MYGGRSANRTVSALVSTTQARDAHSPAPAKRGRGHRWSRRHRYSACCLPLSSANSRLSPRPYRSLFMLAGGVPRLSA
jgi:hypothetical protein